MKKHKHKRLAEGEVTGHSHIVTANDAFVVGEGSDRELAAPKGTDVVHQEHGRITLPAGNYDISRQREFDPEEEQIRAVRD